jgi:hypothetical protein
MALCPDGQDHFGVWVDVEQSPKINVYHLKSEKYVQIIKQFLLTFIFHHPPPSPFFSFSLYLALSYLLSYFLSLD